MAKRTHFQDVSDEIAEGMARALWVTAYANFFDEPEADEDRYINFARAGAGEDWDDVAPETPEAAVKAAKDLEALFAAKNDFYGRPLKRPSIHPTAMHMLYTRALEAKPKGATSPYDFGFLMAMQALGEGVSWFDDHPKFDVEFPRFQTYFDGDELIWSGEGSHKNPRSNDALDVADVTNPTGVLTAKGERMYEDIKRGYEEKGEPRAAEIAMRTVYARAKEGVPGLLRAGKGPPPGVPLYHRNGAWHYSKAKK